MNLNIFQQPETVAQKSAGRAALGQTAARRAELAQQLSHTASARMADFAKNQRDLRTARELVAKRAAALTDAQAAFIAIERAARRADHSHELTQDSVRSHQLP